MVKRLAITLRDDVWEYMEENFTNKSALVAALLTKYYDEKGINITKPTENLTNENIPLPSVSFKEELGL